MRDRNDRPDERHELSQEELDAQGCGELPAREQMSLVNANLGVPVNAAVATVVVSGGSIAYADATQDAPIKRRI